jgi:hypothetical protein
MSALSRITKLETALRRERMTTRPYFYIASGSEADKKLKLLETAAAEAGMAWADYTVIILPPLPEEVDWPSLGLSEGSDCNSLSGKEFINNTISNENRNEKWT